VQRVIHGLAMPQGMAQAAQTLRHVSFMHCNGSRLPVTRTWSSTTISCLHIVHSVTNRKPDPSLIRPTSRIQLDLKRIPFATSNEPNQI
jgi:hypothetical protein